MLFSHFQKSENKGFSLIELLLVTASVGFLVLLLGNLPNSISLIGQSRKESLAREIAVKKIEDWRTIQYINLANGQSSINDQRMRLLPEGNGVSFIEDCDPLVCTQGERAKQVTVTVRWQELGKAKEVKIKTLIAEGGLNQ